MAACDSLMGRNLRMGLCCTGLSPLLDNFEFNFGGCFNLAVFHGRCKFCYCSRAAKGNVCAATVGFCAMAVQGTFLQESPFPTRTQLPQPHAQLALAQREHSIGQAPP